MTQHYLMPTYARQPVSFVRGEGVWLYDQDDNAFMDAISGIGVCNLGHRHPKVTATLQQQAETLLHTSNLYQVPEQERLAEKLCRISAMEKVFFSNSGAEANEAAIKLARLYGHQQGIENPAIIVMENSFHGRTMATLSATGNRKVQAGFEPLVSGFVRVPWNDIEAIRNVASNKEIVAVLVEPVQGEGGVRIPEPGYLKQLHSLCQQQQWLFMLDEIQTGNGRTGHYFAFQQEDILPDVVTTAKGLGNGVPIGACLAQGKAAALFGPGHHGSTYGGNPLVCAVAATVVDEIETLLPQVRERGNYLYQQLQQQTGTHPLVEEVRHRGLMLAIQLKQDCPQMVELAREQGLLINVTAGNVIRLLPPLVISENECEQLATGLKSALDSFAQSTQPKGSEA